MACSLSIVIPVLEGGPAFARCLASVAALAPPPVDVVVVCDGPSRDAEAAARARGFTVMTLGRRSGPAAARNHGARAVTGDVILFLDADVEAPADTVARVSRALDDPSIAAVIGSYDRSPSESGLVSQCRNLAHRFVHQTAREDGFTFWGACGAIRRQAFTAVGGFDETYRESSVEDIELGYRLRRGGYRIRVVKDLEVRHLKRWTVASAVECDVLRRGMPWAELVLREGRLDNDLNLRMRTRVAVLLVGILLCTLAAAPFAWPARVIALAAALLLVAVDWRLWKYFAGERGVRFAVGAMPLQWLHYACGGGAFAFATARWLLQPGRRGRAWTQA